MPCRGGPPAGSNFPDHSGLLTEVCLLGNVAARVPKKLLWDGSALRFTISSYIWRTLLNRSVSPNGLSKKPCAPASIAWRTCSGWRTEENITFESYP